MLKAVPDTKVIAVGITKGVNQVELKIIASSPENVILVLNFDDLSEVEEQLREDACSKYLSFGHLSSCTIYYLHIGSTPVAMVTNYKL